MSIDSQINIALNRPVVGAALVAAGISKSELRDQVKEELEDEEIDDSWSDKEILLLILQIISIALGLPNLR